MGSKHAVVKGTLPFDEEKMNPSIYHRDPIFAVPKVPRIQRPEPTDKSARYGKRYKLGLYSIINVDVYNAAIAGYVGGVSDYKDLTQGVTSDPNLIAEAIAFAQAVDTAINAVTVSPAQLELLTHLCHATCANKYTSGLPTAAFTALATIIADYYAEVSAVFAAQSGSVTFKVTLTGPSQAGLFALPLVAGLTGCMVDCQAYVTSTSGHTEAVGDGYRTVTPATFVTIGDVASVLPVTQGQVYEAAKASMAGFDFNAGINAGVGVITYETPATFDASTKVDVQVTVVLGKALS